MKKITVETIVLKDIDTVWKSWNEPEHITKWAFASDDWECSHAENDLREGGKFLTRMSAKNKSEGFDFNGVYTKVVPNKTIEYIIDGGRTVVVNFEQIGPNSVKVIEEFEMEDINSEELQRAGWQSILENFKKHTEGL